jgi:dTDP-4-dehydrorhamnose 3,5-epimerase
VKFSTTPLPGVVLIEPTVFQDDRGFFMEVYHAEKYAAAGISLAFVQDNHSHSVRGTLRGLHAQRENAQGKLVRALTGEIFDVAVDIRRGSPTYGKWFGATLSADNKKVLYVPPQFAHGFVVTSDTADVEYKCTALYLPKAEFSLRWNDPAVNIQWPIQTPLLSPKDAAAPLLADLGDALPVFAPA